MGRKLIAFGTLVCLFSFCLARGADIYVPDDHATIQGAINAAIDGDTVIVRPGTYVENIDFVGKAITVKSESGPEGTVIDGNQANSVVSFLSGEGEYSVLSGFTVTNGGSTAGAGIYCRHQSSPTITSNIITENDAGSYYGGGIYCNDACPIITGNIIEGNTGSGGGGIRCQYPLSPPAAIISYNLISGNTSDNDGGGGIHCYNCEPIITNNTIEGNRGGVGGGIHLSNTEQPVVTNNLIRDNLARSGGGIFCTAACPTIEYNIIEGNSATSSFWYFGGGGIYCEYGDYQAWTISNNIIRGNSAHGDIADGGGILCWSGDVAITHNIIEGNTADDRGGGYFCSNLDVTVSSNLFSGNTAANLGGGIYCETNTPITNNTFRGNSAGIKGGGLYCYACSPTVVNSIFWNNNAQTGAEIDADLGTPSVTYCDVKGGWTGTGNIDADPLFADSANGDFHLTWDSPCRNTGENSVVTEIHDFEGDPRIHDGAVDMGGDEFHLHLYFIGDVLPGGPIDVKVVGIPATTPVTLGLGSGIQDPPQATPYGDLYLLTPIRRMPMPDIDSDGLSILQGTIPGNWLSGEAYPFQALAGSVLTNLMVVTVE